KVPLLATVDRCLDEALADDTVLDRWIEHVSFDGALFAMGANGARDLGVDVGEALQITLRMPGGRPRHARGFGRGAVAAARDTLLRLPLRGEPQMVRVFLRPLEAASGAIDSQPQRVLVARGHLTCPQDAARAA